MARQEARWVHMSADGLAYTGPGWLVGLVAYFDGVINYLEVHDGVDTGSGRFMMRVASAVDQGVCCEFGDGYRFERGLYVGLQAAVNCVTLLFKPDL